MITPSTVKDKHTGKERTVKNLGWLTTHWKEINSFSFEYKPSSKDTVDGILKADCIYSEYETGFSCITVCFDHFLNRRIFKGLPFTVHNADTGKRKTWTIGDSEYVAVAMLCRQGSRDGYRKALSAIVEAQ